MTSADERTPLANLLIAYPYFEKETAVELVRAEGLVRLVIDSGAFTAWKSGKPIGLDDYCRFLEGLPVKPWRYFTLDVIGDPAATLRNYQTMRARGFSPVPIFTRGEDPSVLDQYYETTDLVGIGGLVGTLKNKAFVNGIMRRVGTRRVHWLGFTAIDYVRAYRPYMCDSSNWESGGRFGNIPLYMGRGRRTISVTRATFTKQRNPEICDRIRALGFEPARLLRGEEWHGGLSLNRNLSAASSLALSLDVQKHLGTLMFHALADTGRGVRAFREAFIYQQGKMAA